MTTQTLNPAAPSAVPNILADRADFRAIARWIEPRSTVLDLGCGDGSLLRVLQDELDVLAYGIEIDDAGRCCVEKVDPLGMVDERIAIALV